MNHDEIVGSIYDCAVNPDLWPKTLCTIRDSFDAAYVMVGHFDLNPLALGKPATAVYRNSPWSEEWLERLFSMLGQIPAADSFWTGDMDISWSQMSQISEEDFHQTPFYLNWVKPQQLRDTLNLNFIRRPKSFGVIAAPRSATRELYNREEAERFSIIAPHIRRAISINDIVDRGNLAVTLYRQMLDSLSAAIVAVGLGGRIVFANGAAERLLSKADMLMSSAGTLKATRIGGADVALESAIARACKGDAAVGISGIGVPLTGKDGARAAAYVLPIEGKDLRSELGEGCAAVFIAQRGEQQPILLEILRTFFDLTPAEARVAALVAEGNSPGAIALTVGISVHTVRTHLARCFAKTGAQDQPSLGALVNGLLPPVDT